MKEKMGQIIRRLRKERDLTQEELAEKVSLSIPHMSHIERGRTKVSLPSLILIANALNTTVDNLLYDNLSVSVDAFDKDFKDLLADCTEDEKRVVYAAAEQVKHALKR